MRDLFHRNSRGKNLHLNYTIDITLLIYKLIKMMAIIYKHISPLRGAYFNHLDGLF